MPVLAGLIRLPHADEGVGGEDHGRGAGRQPIESISEVDGIRPGGDQEVRPQDEKDQTHRRPGEGQVEIRVAREGDAGGGRREPTAVREEQRHHGEGNADERLPQHFLPGAQAQ